MNSLTGEMYVCLCDIHMLIKSQGDILGKPDDN